jgi:hypothetical protein
MAKAHELLPFLVMTMKRRIVPALIIGTAGLSLLGAGWVIVVVNPFEWGAETSATFTWEKFDEVKRGEPIVSVIQMLGQPIERETLYETTTGNELTRVCSEVARCRQYQFAGVRLIGGREAIVIADARTGLVLDKRINYEP